MAHRQKATLSKKLLKQQEGEEYLLDMVDLIMFALLVAGDLPLGLVPKLPALLHTLPHRVLHRLCERQARFTDPLIQPPID